MSDLAELADRWNALAAQLRQAACGTMQEGAIDRMTARAETLEACASDLVELAQRTEVQ